MKNIFFQTQHSGQLSFESQNVVGAVCSKVATIVAELIPFFV